MTEKKRWTKENCARRYIEGDRIGLRKLAIESNIPFDTLQNWSRAENWVEQRRQFTDKVTAATQAKSIEKTSEKLSEELSDIALANYSVHRKVRDYAAAVFEMKIRHLESIKDMELEQQMKELRSHQAYEMNSWSLVLTRATQGIESATGLAYHVNINAAAKKLDTEGYEVVEKSQELE